VNKMNAQSFLDDRSSSAGVPVGPFIAACVQAPRTIVPSGSLRCSTLPQRDDALCFRQISLRYDPITRVITYPIFREILKASYVAADPASSVHLEVCLPVLFGIGKGS
jgi:hypothetical protein